MQQIDSTAVATALPSMAANLGVSPIKLHSVITIYLLALAAFLPISGWLADRFGARRVFCAAIALFTLASLACALSADLTMLILSRFVQGVGAAMMLPTGRLILVRSVPRSELVSAIALMGMPAVIGPVVGPLFGGFVTEISSWRWIFWVNLPIGAVSIMLVLLLIDKVPSQESKPLDFMGFLISGLSIGILVFGLDSLARGSVATTAALVLSGSLGLGFYMIYARRRPNAILDLGLFRYPTFRASMFGGTLFRVGFGALPFLLPLMMQEALGYTPLQSGAITFVSAIGAFGMRPLTGYILRRFGFRSVLSWNALIASLFIGLCAIFNQATPLLVILAVIFVGGVFRALQLTSLNALVFAEVTDKEMSHAATLSQMALRVSQGGGIAGAAAILHLSSGVEAPLTNAAFAASYVAMAIISAVSYFSFITLSKTAGDALVARQEIE